MAEMNRRQRLRAKRDRLFAIIGGGSMVIGSLWAFRPWDKLTSAAINGAERLPEPLQTMATMAACQGKRWSDQIPAFPAGAARSALPEVCQSDLGARLATESVELASRGAIATTVVAALAIGRKLYGHLGRPADPEFLKATPMSVGHSVRPGPHHRAGLPGLVGKAALRAARRGSVAPARA